MARRQTAPIRTISYIPLTSDGSAAVRMDDLNEKQRTYIGTRLKLKILNARYMGSAAFSAPDLPLVTDVFPEQKSGEDV